MNLGAQLAAAMAAAVVSDSDDAESDVAQAVAAAVAQAPLDRNTSSATQLLVQRASAIDSAMGENAPTRTASSPRASLNSLLPQNDSRQSNVLLVIVTGGNVVQIHAENACPPWVDSAVHEVRPDATQAADDLFASLDDDALSTWVGSGGLQ
jgi:hypothetical protein